MKFFASITLFLVLLTGCETIPNQNTTPAAFPSPVGTLLLEKTESADQPASSNDITPPSTDENFRKDTVYLDLAEIRTLDGQPGLVILHLEGQLPTPCHQFASAICPACSKNTTNLIEIKVYSLIESGRECRGPTNPFEQDIPLGVYSEGIHSVSINGQHVETFDAAKLGQADAFVTMVRGNVFVEKTNIVPPQSENEQALLTIQGNMPSPCHIFQANVAIPDAENIVRIEAYSLMPDGQACIGAIQGFTTDVPLGMLLSGTYSVWLNGEAVGDVAIP